MQCIPRGTAATPCPCKILSQTFAYLSRVHCGHIRPAGALVIKIAAQRRETERLRLGIGESLPPAGHGGLSLPSAKSPAWDTSWRGAQGAAGREQTPNVTGVLLTGVIAIGTACRSRTCAAPLLRSAAPLSCWPLRHGSRLAMQLIKCRSIPGCQYKGKTWPSRRNQTGRCSSHPQPCARITKRPPVFGAAVPLEELRCGKPAGASSPIAPGTLIVARRGGTKRN